jgi:hypothetical protein
VFSFGGVREAATWLNRVIAGGTLAAEAT